MEEFVLQVLERIVAAEAKVHGIPFEAATPTGVAILTTAAERFDPSASMIPRRVGHGVGSREGVVPNLLRVVLADTLPGRPEELSVLQCNIDDVDPELYPHLLDRLLAVGAKDAWVEPLVMKKGRPGILVSILCEGRNEASNDKAPGGREECRMKSTSGCSNGCVR